MTTQVNDGRPAFPVTYQHVEGDTTYSERWEGMSYRQWLAGRAMQGIVRKLKGAVRISN